MGTNLAYEMETPEEIINGKVVMMASPTVNHMFIAGNIYTLFNVYLRGKRCVPYPDGVTLFLDDKENYKPDMMVVCDPDKMKETDGVHGAPDLAVEILSPSTWKNDRGHKKDMYEKHGVREYWIVDPMSRVIEQYVSENGRFVLRDVYQQRPSYLLGEMTEEERAAAKTEFKCTLFDDLTIRLEDVFYRVSPGV